MAALPRSVRDLRYRLFYGLFLRHGYELKRLGAPNSICQWTICPNGLDSKSVVYSGGLGSDITFEHDVAKRFGCDLVLYDPSPTGVNTMSLPENKIPQFRFYPVALAAHTGKLTMAPPLNGVGDSWFAAPGRGPGNLELNCVDLQTFMKQNGHEYIDLLKMDIEGSEYEVIDDLLRRRIPVRQICVEFHHGTLPTIPRRRTIASILKLLTYGYRLVNQAGNDHTFILPRWPA